MDYLTHIEKTPHLGAGAQQPVVKVSRLQEREIFRQIQAPNLETTGVFRGFGNAELTEKIRSQRGLSFATGCQGQARRRSGATVTHGARTAGRRSVQRIAGFLVAPNKNPAPCRGAGFVFGASVPD